MPNNINYNLNYFIMRMSGTKPMKNTMRKPPIRQEMANNPTELKTNPDVTSTNNNRRGIGVRGKKVSGIQVKNSKTKSAETIAKDEASKKAMDKYVKITKSRRALRSTKK
jgi:type 1 fimbria pilin